MTGDHIKGKFTHGHSWREEDVKKHRKKTHLKAKERGLEQSLSSQPSEGTNPGDTLTSDFHPPKLSGSEYVV